MDTAKGKVIDRIPRRTGVQLSHEVLEADIRRASVGDVKAAERLLTELAGEDRRVQSRVAAVILRTADRGFWDHLLEFIRLGTWGSRQVALHASVTPRNLQPKLAGLFLSRQDRPSAPARLDTLAAGLSSPDANVRRLAVDLLRQWHGPIDPGPLVSLLHDADTGVRLRAARALGRVGDVRVVPALIETLGHVDDLIAGEAADALARIGEPALGLLINALGHKDPHVRWHAAKALAEMANPRAAGALIAALDDEDFSGRWCAAEGLASMGTSALFTLLKTLRAQKMTPWLAEGAIHVLKNVKDPKLVLLVEELEKMLWDAYANVEVPIEADRVLRKLEEAYRNEARSL